jgi:inner membrane protein
MQRALLWKVVLVGLVALLLQIPVGMVRGLVSERQQARDGVLADIARGTSEAQRIAGPVLVIPWLRRSTESIVVADDGGRTRTTTREKVERGSVVLLPDALDVRATSICSPSVAASMNRRCIR